jgi:RNA polymerase sigma-70 factor, ECF subfamily
VAAIDDEKSRILQSQNGDHNAFEALIKEHQRMIHSLCYRMTGTLADADDLAQETFIQAFQHLATFRTEARFSSWVYRIALNQCLNWRKGNVRRERLHKEFILEAEDRTSDPSPSSELIQQALMKLNAKERAAIILTIYEGLTHAQAARALGCSETTVSWRLFVARAKLKRLLKSLASAGRRA